MLRSSRHSFLSRLFKHAKQRRVESVRFLGTLVCPEGDRSLVGKATAEPARLFHRGEEPPKEETIGELLNQAAKTWPNRECIVSLHQNVRLTFSDVLRRADRLASGLLKLGLKRGDRLGIWGPNDVEWFLSCMSAARAGLVVVAINPAYRPDELIHSLNITDAKAVITPGKFKTQDYTQMLLDAKASCLSLDHVILYSQEPVAGTRSFSDVESMANASEVGEISARQNDVSPYDGCNMQFTSGTTGKPKAALVSHRSLWNNSRQGMSRMEIKAGEKMCLNVPFFHAFGLIMGQFGALHAGATLILASPSFEPVKSIEAMAAEKCNVAYGTPTMWVHLVDAQERLKAPLNHLRTGTTGGSPAPPELFKRISDSFRFDNMQSIYGLTECTGIAFQTLPGDSIEARQSTVGHLSDNVEVMSIKMVQ